jgi:hypothetical protein
VDWAYLDSETRSTTQIGEAGMARIRGAAEGLRSVRVAGGCRQIEIVVGVPVRERGNRQIRERSSSVRRVVLLLTDSDIVKQEVGEVRRQMTGRAVTGMLGAVRGSARRFQKNVEACKFSWTKLERKRVV